ncbi:hypothetical protein GA0061105_12134 [Rhizobium aethiopicum]|uniref:Uncharacterized protein n=1 Tax=Rhizobium aethiopicum TaxID=1138170 RepID=A0A1C3YB22_9HYPH|nr:hypothetical protein GA0061105_12134 [Rhizobium aethiopicum]
MMLCNSANVLSSRKGKKHSGWARSSFKRSMSQTSGAVRP